MGVELRPNVHYTAELNDRIGFVLGIRTDERDRASFLIEEADGTNSVLPAGRETTLTSYRTIGEAWEAAGFDAEIETTDLDGVVFEQ